MLRGDDKVMRDNANVKKAQQSETVEIFLSLSFLSLFVLLLFAQGFFQVVVG